MATIFPFRHAPLGVAVTGCLVLLSAGCTVSTISRASDPADGVAAVEARSLPPQRITDRESNLDGVVPILQYHHVADPELRWQRSLPNFRADLQRLYKMGFRPVTLSEYLDDAMELPPGASPVVITFDDSHPSQFRMLQDGSVDPDSAVGIWLEFAERHPDFPVKATFYILPRFPFGQAKFVDAKLALLREWGSEIGSHTVSHRNLSGLTDEEVKAELAGAIDFIQVKGFSARSIALPYGVAPKNRDLLRQFTYRGRTYSMEAVLLAGSNPAPAPTSQRFDPYRLPRIQAYEGVYGIRDWLDRIEQGKVQPYVAP